MSNARRYEALVLLDVSLGEEKLEEMITKLEEIIKASEGGEILTLDRWGKKRLAYEINKKQFGYYVLFEFNASAKLPAEMDRYCRLESGVIRHMVLHIPPRVLKLRAKEEKIRAAMEQRRLEAAEKTIDPHVEDLLEHEGEAFEEGIPEDFKPDPNAEEEVKKEDSGEKPAEAEEAEKAEEPEAEAEKTD